ncbi:MAG: acyl-CoA dehydrogenase [Gammaproteobacteria bacterium]
MFKLRAALTTKLLAYFQKSLPHISETEKIVLEAGDVGWEKALFSGQPNWETLHALPQPHLTEAEHAFLEQETLQLCQLLTRQQISESDELTPEVWDFIKQHGFLGMSIAQTYGGKGFSVFAQSQIVCRIASRSMSAAISIMVPNALGPAEFLQHYGTPEQKHYYLPRLATGIEIPAFALTSTQAGSDAGSIKDCGIVCYGEYEGQSVLGLRLNWEKRYITLAPIASLLGLAVRVTDPEHLLGEKIDLGITLCLVPTHLPDVETGLRHSPAGMGFLNGPTAGKDVFIPLDLIIGGPTQCGQGWFMMMQGLAAGRGVSLPALSTAIAQVCFRTTSAYAALREQFHTPIGQFEGVAARLARIGGLTYLCEATRQLTLSGLLTGQKSALAAAITKYHLTEMARVLLQDALDIHAGRGVQLGPSNYLWSLYQAAPICITVEGANILTRNLIIFGQGAIRCHPFIKAEIDSLTIANPTERVKKFGQLVKQHIGYIVKNAGQTLLYGLTGGRGISVKKFSTSPLKGYYQQLTRMSQALAFTVDIVMAVVGADLKWKENVSARLGDILSQLYLASAVLKYHQDQNTPEDLPLAQWALSHCLYEIDRAFTALFQNFAPRWLGRLLYRMIFPFGADYALPSDALEQRIAKLMMQSSALRDRLTYPCYAPSQPEDKLGRMDLALEALSQNSSETDENLALLKRAALRVDTW